MSLLTGLTENLSTMDRIENTSGDPEAPQMVLRYPASEQLSSECVEALSAEIVFQKKSHRFFCVCCKIKLTGAAQFKQHIHSEKHKLKRAIHELAAEISNMSRLRIDAAQDFPWTVKTSINPEPPSDIVYRNLSQPRGLVVIFNYNLTGDIRREGAQRDSVTLRTLFTRMGNTVQVHEDYTKQKTKVILKYLQVDPLLQQIDSFIMIILSYGKGSLIFYTNDKKEMSLDEMRGMFVDQACPNLRDKPKIFLANFSRDKWTDNPRRHEASFREDPKDMITWYSCIDRFMAMRDVNEGTVFAQALCRVLAKHSHNTELGELYLRLCEVMHRKGGSTPEQQNYLFKKFYFNPIQLHD